MAKMTAPALYAKKGADQKIVCITAYDYTSALIAQSASPDVILVGDSLGNVVLGEETTLGVELEDILRATYACAKAVDNALLVADLPFGSYQTSTEDAVRSAIACMKAGASAVKLEGAYTEQIEQIVRAGIPVMGHIGFTPQSVHAFGGHKVQGKSNADRVISDAKALDEAGVFSMVLELIPASLSRQITDNCKSPTIGIGAGIHCDGQIQVFHDVMGLSPKVYKHAKPYANGFQEFCSAMNTYVEEVRSSRFPTEENSF